MPIAYAPSVHDAAHRVLRTTANAWRLKSPARRPQRTHRRVRNGVEGGMGRCPVRSGSPLPGYGPAFSY